MTNIAILQNLSGKSRNNRDLILKAVAMDGMILALASDELRNDP